MENSSQQRRVKVTIKWKSDQNVGESSGAADLLNDVQNLNVSSSANLPGSPSLNSQDQGNFNPARGSENHITEDEENAMENSQKQLVPYDPAVNGSGASGTVPDPVNRSLSSSRPHPFSTPAPKVLPSIGVFTVQCATCFKWRLIPTKEKYEEIREHIMINPFTCETGRAWRPDVSCDDPPDIKQDGSRLWAIDKPSIAQPPPGWQRLLRIRSEGSSKFADVYYVAPTGKRLRSMVEVQKFLDDHPQYKEAGIALSKFSFQIPKPLQDDYVRKRPAPVRPAPMPDVSDHGMPRPAVPMEVQPISWVSPDVGTNLKLNSPGPSNNHSLSYNLTPETQPAKKKKTPAQKQRRSHGNTDTVHNENGVKGQESHPPMP